MGSTAASSYFFTTNEHQKSFSLVPCMLGTEPRACTCQEHTLLLTCTPLPNTPNPYPEVTELQQTAKQAASLLHCSVTSNLDKPKAAPHHSLFGPNTIFFPLASSRNMIQQTLPQSVYQLIHFLHFHSKVIGMLQTVGCLTSTKEKS